MASRFLLQVMNLFAWLNTVSLDLKIYNARLEKNTEQFIKVLLQAFQNIQYFFPNEIVK